MTTLRSLFVAIGAGLGLYLLTMLGEVPGGPLLRAPLGVAVGVAVASVMYGEAAFAAITVGAISPLALAALEQTSFAGAVATMCTLWLAPRFVLAATKKQLLVLAAASLVAALIAGLVFASYVAAPLAAHVASCVFAGACLSLVGIVVPLPAPQTHALRASAEATTGPTRAAILLAAQTFESSRWQPRTADERRKWRGLIQLADRRATLDRTGGARAVLERQELAAQIEKVAEELSKGAHPTTGSAMAKPDSASDATSPNAESIDATSAEGSAMDATGATLPAAVDAAIAKIEEGETLIEVIAIEDAEQAQKRQM
jgi:hypothetical protein